MSGIQYILDDLEYMTIIEDLLGHQFVQDLRYYKHHHMNTRYNHSLEVSYLTYKWSKRMGMNYGSAARASLLHDLFYYDCKDDRDIVPENHLAEHPQISLMNARQITQLTELEEDMILKHMWLPGRPRPSYKESWVLTVMDKYCAVKDICIVPIKKRLKKHKHFYVLLTV